MFYSSSLLNSDFFLHYSLVSRVSQTHNLPQDFQALENKECPVHKAKEERENFLIHMAAKMIGNEKQNQKSFGEVIGKDVLHFTQINDHSTMLDIKRSYIQLPHDYSSVRQK